VIQRAIVKTSGTRKKEDSENLDRLTLGDGRHPIKYGNSSVG